MFFSSLLIIAKTPTIFRDRIRTVVNVMGDSFGAGIIYEWSKDDIRELNERTTSRERNFSSNSVRETQARNQSSINLDHNSSEND